MANGIPIHVQRQVRRPQPANLIPLSHADATTAMERRTAGIIGKGISDIGTEVAEYAQKHKQHDMAVDDAAFALHYKNTMNQAQIAAEKTANPDDVHSIYEQANKQVRDYIDGRNEAGTPNIRWKDHADQARIKMSGIEAESKERAGRRVLDIYKDDSRAKHRRLAAEFIENEDAEGFARLGPVMRESGLYTDEQVNEAVQKGEFAIAEKVKNRPYNESLRIIAEAEQDYALGGDLGRLMQTYSDIKEMAEEGAYTKDQKDRMIYNVTSKENVHYRRDRKQRSDALIEIHKSGATSAFGAGDGTEYLGIFGDNMQQIQASSAQLRKGAEIFATTRDGADMQKALDIVDSVFGGVRIYPGIKKNDTKYTVSKGLADIKNLDPKVAYVANYLLGVSMMADVDGTSDEQTFKITNVRPRALDEVVAVEKGSFVGDIRRSLGPLVASGNQDAQWVKEVFDKAYDWQMGDGKDATNEEKASMMTNLLGERAMEVIEGISAPQIPPPQTARKLSEQDQQALNWANANPDDPRSAKIKSKLGVE